MWNNKEKAIELILVLKGNASVVHESVPVSSRNNYDDIMEALQRKYGGEHKKELYRMELRGGVQKAIETLQDFALEIERLLQLTYTGEHQFLDMRFVPYQSHHSLKPSLLRWQKKRQ
ncbi:hypothetical protein FF38_14270 [Lucilia cuprina]|uniref:Retrotransposon gag domain-containing protein n=1 Tax=Lucilia cuprina TaxID=7375 RepID=A0A0L0CNZ0_LUCCU|nr:hypothetical protein FF38_14270 [Lucilia cuprina]